MDSVLSLWKAEGAGNPILFIHGNSGCKEVFYEQFRYFAGLEYTLLAVDLPGHGESRDALIPEVEYTIPNYASLLTALIDEEGLENPLVVGWSLGGHIAVEMIGQGARIAGALLVGTPPAGPGGIELSQAFLDSEAAGVTMKEGATQEELQLYARSLYGTLNQVPPYFYDTAFRTDGRARRVMGEHWGNAYSDGHHQRTVVSETELPIAVVHGMSDPFISYDYLSQMTWGSLWGGEIQCFDGVGHAAFLERPSKFNELLRRFSSEIYCQ